MTTTFNEPREHQPAVAGDEGVRSSAGWMHWFAARWGEFVEGNQEVFRPFVNPRFLVSVSAAWVLIRLVGQWWLGIRPLFIPVPIAGTALYIGVLVPYLLVFQRLRVQRNSSRMIAAHMAMMFVGYLALLVDAALGPEPMAWMMMAIMTLFLLLTSALNPLGPRFPIWSAMPIVACLLVQWIPMDDRRRWLVIGGSLFAAVSSIGSSIPGVRVYRGMSQQAALLAALEVQRTTEVAIDAQRTLSSLESVMSHSHDAMSPLLAARATASLLREQVGELGAEGHALLPTIDRMEESLSRVADLLGASRDEARGFLGEHYALVPAATVIDRVLREQQLRFPKVVLRARTADVRSLRLRMFRGEESLVRIVTNLVVNACEGDRRGHATEVTVSLDIEGVLLVSDNGPGFASGDDNQEISLKPGGVGLGLFTVERLVRASGGTMRRRNRDGGGAEVELRLGVG